MERHINGHSNNTNDGNVGRVQLLHWKLNTLTTIKSDNLYIWY